MTTIEIVAAGIRMTIAAVARAEVVTANEKALATIDTENLAAADTVVTGTVLTSHLST